MYPFFQENDKRKFKEIRESFSRNNAFCCVISAVNVFLVASYSKRVLNFSLLKKILFGGAVFVTSYSLGMYYPKKNIKEFNSKLLEKYREEFLSKNLNINK